jgi:dephospho-CoA kinase
MLNLRKVAITGGVSSGKTLVCQFLKECGAYVVSADEIVYELLSPNTPIGQQVISLLGPWIVVGNTIDRSLIAKIVFSDQKKLTALEKILHPAVIEEIKRQYHQIQHHKPPFTLFAAEVPLLYEANFAPFFDDVITVAADDQTCKERFHEKTGQPMEEYDRRMQRQLPAQQKKAKASFTINNKGTKEELKREVFQFYKNYIQRSIFNGSRA